MSPTIRLSKKPPAKPKQDNPFKAKPKDNPFSKPKLRLAATKPNPFAKPEAEVKPKDNPFKAPPKPKPAKGSSKRDFSDAGIRYHNVLQTNGYWQIDVTTGDETITLHNRHGSWLMDTERGHKEPRREVAFGLQDRLLTEMKALGIPTREERLRLREEEERQKRKKRLKHADNG